MAAAAAPFGGQTGADDLTGNSSSSCSRSSSGGGKHSARKGGEVGKDLSQGGPPADADAGVATSEDASSSGTDSHGASSGDGSGSTDDEDDLPSQAAPPAAGGALASAAARLAALRERRADAAEELAALSEAPRRRRCRRPRQRPQRNEAVETDVAPTSRSSPTEQELAPYLRVAAARIHERNAVHPSLPKRLLEREIDVALREGELERAALVSTTMANLADAEVVALATAMWRHEHARAQKKSASRKRKKLTWMFNAKRRSETKLK